jgi:hypothetical protein
METLDEIRQIWRDSKDKQLASYIKINKENMKIIIVPRIKKEQRPVKEYVIKFIFWQIFVYSALCYFIVRYRSDHSFAIFCSSGILVFIFYTILFQIHIKKIRHRLLNRADLSLREMGDKLKNEISVTTKYYEYKKMLDWVCMPIISGVMLTIIFKISPVPHTGMAGLITFGIILLALGYATHLENKRNFIGPMDKMRLILKDIEKEDN